MQLRRSIEYITYIFFQEVPNRCLRALSTAFSIMVHGQVWRGVNVFRDYTVDNFFFPEAKVLQVTF